LVDMIAGQPEAWTLLRMAMNDETVDMKTRVAAATAFLDRTGNSPLGRTSKPSFGGAAKLPAFASMTAEEARDYERRLADRSNE
ncbi:MAG TPA: hypothetical protein VLA89_15925, partial [Gemmatimonadales bacterium]|nr:hypothetical protein [Gemmatimonadales bacterium]